MPPRVTQQATTNSRVKSGPVGSILSQGIDLTDIEEGPMRILIYGPNRAGKTTLACTFPKPLALIAFEPNPTGGANSVRKIQGGKYYRITKSESALQLADELRQDNYFKSVVIDSATSYQDVFLKEILKVETLPDQLEFGEVTPEQYRMRSERVKEGLRPFLNLNKHVIVLAKEKDHNPPKEERVGKSGKIQPDMRPRALRGMQQESYVAADLGAGSAMWLNDACDLIARIYLAKETETKTIDIGFGPSEQEVETGRFVRRLWVGYHPNYAAGLRTPYKCPDYIDNPTYDKIAAVIRGEEVK